MRTGFRSRGDRPVLDRRGVGVELVALPPGDDRGMRGLGGGDAREHGVVVALDARDVDEAGGAAEQRAAREGELRHRLPAALGDRPRAVGDALAARAAASAISGWCLKRWNSM